MRDNPGMTTLEGVFEDRLRALSAKRTSSETVSEEEVEYMLAAMPFIREYTSNHSKSTAPRRGIDNFVTVKHRNNKHHVFQNYLAEVEKDESARPISNDTARALEDAWTCSCGAKCVYNQRESELVCPECGHVRPHMEMSEHNITYDQEVQQMSVASNFAYKRLNHFTEWLNSLQAKENTEIPTEVLEAVRAEFKKERASKRSDIKPQKVKAFLKKLKLNGYYEHTHTICNALNGVPAPKLPRALEERLKHMFGEIQKPFEKWCPPDRKNFLSYSYVLFKFCELLGEVSFCRFCLDAALPSARSLFSSCLRSSGRASHAAFRVCFNLARVSSLSLRPVMALHCRSRYSGSSHLAFMAVLIAWHLEVLEQCCLRRTSTLFCWVLPMYALPLGEVSL
jgi:predicted RNA-binding Zn-ribbon protein involved in translation (DUF1610 family)